MSNKVDLMTMNQEKKHELKPKLRFPDFRDAGEWENRKFGEFITERSQPSDENCVLFSLTIEDGITPKTERYERAFLVGNTENAYKMVLHNDFAYNPMNLRFGAIGRYVGEKAVALSKYYNIFYCNETVDFQFFEFYLKSHNMIVFYNKMAIGSLIEKTRVHFSNFIKFKIPFPSLPEQQKIADCLSSIGDRITAETQKLDTLKAHKKGLIQQLFPAEGETLPKLRFPEFRDTGDWELKTLNSFCKVGDINHKMPSSVVEGIPYIMTGDFFGINNIDFNNAKKISPEDYEQLSKKIKPEFGDIVVARYASVGAVRYIETNIKFLVSYSCAIIKCNRYENSKYLYYIFQSDVIQSKMGLEINRSSQKNIGIESIKKLNIFLPTLPEQQKIADCLSSLDELITAQTQKIDELKLHKKGLMQQLFPSVEEVKE